MKLGRASGVHCWALVGGLLLSGVIPLWAEQMVFPADFGHVNVRTYGAVGDGKTDDTRAIQRCIDENHNDHIIYLPKGTYLVSATIKWAEGQKRTLLWGEDREQTVIQLKDQCPGFGSFLPNSKGELVLPVPLVWTGNAPAQRFRNGLRNLTINTGRGNPAVSALQYNTSNQGSVWYVNLISGDGGGHAGLDISYTGEIGPGLVYDMKIVGFDSGVKSWVYNSMTLMKMQLEQQKKVGIRHAGGVLSIWGLSSINAVPVIENDAVLTLIDAQCSGGAPTTNAIVVRNGSLYARSVRVAGYKSAIVNNKGTGQGAAGPLVDAFVSHAPQGVFDAAPTSLQLPLTYPPQVPWENDMTKWANPMKYGAVGDGKADDTRALQAAIDDSSKTTLYFPVGKSFKISSVKLRGTIGRFVCFGWNRIIKGGVIEVVDGAAPVVQVDNINGLYYDVSLTINTSRTVLLTSCSHAHVVDVRGSGRVYLMDNVGNNDGYSMHLNAPGQRVYLIQHNTEANGAAQSHRGIVNNGSRLVVFGLKTENWGTKIHTRGGGFTEVLGGWVMGNGTAVKTEPIFSVDSAHFSAVNVRSVSSTSPPSPFLNWVEEVRDGELRTLKKEDVGGSILVLYTGYSTRSDSTLSGRVPMLVGSSSNLGGRVAKKITLRAATRPLHNGSADHFLLSGRRFCVAAPAVRPLGSQCIVERSCPPAR